MMGRRRLKKKYRRVLHLILAGLVLLIALICLARHCEQREPEPSRYYPSIRNLKAQFNDLNPLHLEAGRSLGLAEPPESREDINTWRLREIKDCRYYVVDRLDYSVPYLTRGGARLLDEIGENFSFRIMKHEFKARPVYLSRDARITAHFTICFLALILFRYLEKMLGHKYTCEQISSGLRQMKFRKLEDVGYLPAYTRNDFTDALHEAFGFRTDYEILSKSQMRNLISLTKKK